MYALKKNFFKSYDATNKIFHINKEYGREEYGGISYMNIKGENDKRFSSTRLANHAENFKSYYINCMKIFFMKYHQNWYCVEL